MEYVVLKVNYKKFNMCLITYVGVNYKMSFVIRNCIKYNNQKVKRLSLVKQNYKPISFDNPSLGWNPSYNIVILWNIGFA
jgi:hypothetical protein